MNDALMAVLGSEFPDLQGAIDVDIVTFTEGLGHIRNRTVEDELVPVRMLFLFIIAGPVVAFSQAYDGLSKIDWHEACLTLGWSFE